MTIGLGLLFFITALLYASVGLGGGSGYLAVMGLWGVPPEMIRPTALSMNVLVAAIGTYKHVRAGNFSPRLFWPIALTSIPFAFLGGRLVLPEALYRSVVGMVLLYTAVRLWRSASQQEAESSPNTAVLPWWTAVAAGGAIGLLSGLVGIGGGTFLGPFLLLAGWANTRQTMSITAAFVLVNSLAGLAGNLTTINALPAQIPTWLVVVGIGGWLGAELGSKKLNPITLRRLLAFVLFLAGARMLLTLIRIG